MIPWSPWLDERWVALMKGDSRMWRKASWRARALFALICRVVLRGDGRRELDGDVLGDGLADLAERLHAETTDLEAPLRELLSLGLVCAQGHTLFIPGWLDGNDLPNGAYVRLYTRDSAAWIGHSVWARGLWCLLLLDASRDGIHYLGAVGFDGLAKLLRMRLDELRPIIDELLGNGTSDLLAIDEEHHNLVIPKFREGQETPTSEAARQRAARERGRGKEPGSSTSSRQPSRPITSRHAPSRAVTPGHSDPIHAEPNGSDPSLYIPASTSEEPGRLSRAHAPAEARATTERAPESSGPKTKPSPAVLSQPQHDDLLAQSHQPHPSPPRLTPAFGWASPEEQAAGELLIDRMRHAPAGTAPQHCPLVGIADPKVVRRLLEYTCPEVCGQTGRLEIADVILCIDNVARSEADRMLGAVEVPKPQGELIRYLIGAVKKRKRGDARRAAAERDRVVAEAIPELDDAQLALVRAAAEWAWPKGREPRLFDEQDAPWFAQLWTMAKKHASQSTLFANATDSDIQRICAYWLRRHFGETDAKLIERGYPLGWLFSDDASRIKAYGMPPKRAIALLMPTQQKRGDSRPAQPQAAEVQPRENSKIGAPRARIVPPRTPEELAAIAEMRNAFTRPQQVAQPLPVTTLSDVTSKKGPA